MNKDTITGIVGAVLLIGAMVGVFFYERAQAADLLADAGEAFEAIEAQGPSASGNVALNGQASEDITIEKENLTRVTFTLTWTATNGADTLTLKVQPPDGVDAGNVSQPEDDGSITVTVDVANPEPVDGAQTIGVGTWRVTVEFVEATATLPVQQDQSVDWEVATTLTTWQAVEDTAGDA